VDKAGDPDLQGPPALGVATTSVTKGLGLGLGSRSRRPVLGFLDFFFFFFVVLEMNPRPHTYAPRSTTEWHPSPRNVVLNSSSV
jgi:hypothetical protein